MKPTDLTGLIKGLMVVIAIALSLGKLSDLKRWAAHEAFGLHAVDRRALLHSR